MCSPDSCKECDKVQHTWDFTMVEIMTTNCMVIRIQIGQEVPQTGIAPQVDIIV